MIATCENCGTDVIISNEIDANPPIVLCKYCRNQTESVITAVICVVIVLLLILIVGAAKIFGF